MLNDGVVMMGFLLPVVDSEGGSGFSLGIVCHVFHGSKNLLQCRMTQCGYQHVVHVTLVKAK